MFHLEYKPEPVGYAGTSLLDVQRIGLGTLQYALCNKYVRDDELKKRSQQPLYQDIWLVTSDCAVAFPVGQTAPVFLSLFHWKIGGLPMY